MLNILILEDDMIQRKILAEIIQKIDKHFVIYEADNEKEGIEIANEKHISLFYVDITLKDSSGLDFAKNIRNISKYKLTWIIFITTHIKHMLEAFKEVHCYDYIIKPYDKKAVEEFTLTLLKNKQAIKPLTFEEKRYVIFDIKGILLKLYVDEIIFIEVFLRTSIIYTKTEKYELNNTPLKKVKELMKNFNFIQVHRSYLVNLNLIKIIDKASNSWNIQFRDYEDTVPIGNKFKDELVTTFSSFCEGSYE